MKTAPEIRRTVVASVLGTTIEFYDFLVYGTASVLVFNDLFFSNLRPWAATFAALATYAVGFVARPVGGMLFGHFGDRRGRKNMLSASMLLMGLGTFIIGLLPTYQQIGSWSVMPLLLLRFAQGIGVGGEWGGAVLMVIENSPGRRGFLGALVQVGFSLGVFLATVMFLLLQLMPPTTLHSWGWRLPFLASAALFPIGVFVRSRLHETAAFTAVQRSGRIARLPLGEVVRRDWRICLTGIALKLSEVSWVFVLTIYSVASVRATGNVPVQAVLWGVALGTLLETVTLPIIGHLSDVLGRKPILVVGAVLSIVMAYPVLSALQSTNAAVVAGILALALNVGHGIMFAAEAAAIPEQFEARVRYSGASFTYQIASAIGGGGAPIAATAFLAWSSHPEIALTGLMSAIGVVSLLAALAVKETAFGNLLSGELLKGEHPLKGHGPADCLPAPEPVVPAEE